ncbi:MAG: hypothetical protein Homavirus20_5 [Homavirus sp.]|uniref:Uncharacterized protein n=1 Tax=Homavirus sp. TaxID=2487769 RepID=A0A3G5A4V4_9VIRU|nr:MAG: hypothetical protein Homavirus20_5 [Homavirus sp.]
MYRFYKLIRLQPNNYRVSSYYTHDTGDHNIPNMNYNNQHKTNNTSDNGDLTREVILNNPDLIVMLCERTVNTVHSVGSVTMDAVGSAVDGMSEVIGGIVGGISG